MLSETDKQSLKLSRNTDREIEQIEQAMTVAILECRGKCISRKKAITLLGCEKFFSGMLRSAYHWNSVQNIENGESVLLDSARLFRAK